MSLNSKMSRKEFLKWMKFLLFIPFIWMIIKMNKDHQRFGTSRKPIKLPNGFSPGLSIEDEVIICKTDNDLKIYSSKCTHLGCKINKVENNELVCPCHGSRYNSSGIPVKGPSVKALEELTFEIDKSTNEIIIQLS